MAKPLDPKTYGQQGDPLDNVQFMNSMGNAHPTPPPKTQRKLQPEDYFNQRVADNWLIGLEGDRFIAQVHHYLQEITAFPDSSQPTILLAEADPVDFLAGFMAACMQGCPVFLCNPNWSNTEWRQVFFQVQPDLIWGDGTVMAMEEQWEMGEKTFFPASFPKPETIMIPTGGSSGQVRFAVHTWQTLMASVQGFQAYFGLKAVHSFCVLPLYHVSGLMQFLRSLTSGGTLVVQAFKPWSLGLIEGNGMGRQAEGRIDPTEFFMSLVPTQLQRLLTFGHQSPAITQWLSQLKTILLGGAPAWPDLLAQARHHQLNLALTYGMTETASQIVTLKPQDFLAGNDSCGQILPHAQIRIQDSEGRPLPPNQIGTLSIQAQSQALGYYHNFPLNHLSDTQAPVSVAPPRSSSSPSSFCPDDLGFLDKAGYLHIVGRSSDKIISGGENVFPAEVEAVIQATGFVQDVCVLGIPHPHWGEAVTAVYVPVDHEPMPNVETIRQAISPQLSPYKQPKKWVAVERLPRNAQGKISRDRLRLELNQQKKR